MPELPEVQTIINDLKKKIIGRKIIDIRTITKSIWRNGPPPQRKIVGAKVSNIERKGKYILIRLSCGRTLVTHLKMTGRYTIESKGKIKNKHTHCVFVFDEFELHFSDVRRFGFLDLIGISDINSTKYLIKIGPDPFEINKGEFIRLIQSKKRIIKPLLMDQTVISGLGNIYADEALFRAGIHPRKNSSKISKVRAGNLYGSIIEILDNAIRARGSSVSDYVDGSGRRGGYQHEHLVYGKEGEPCPKCGRAIKREKIGGRSAHYCTRCQR